MTSSLYYNDYASSQCCRSEDDWRQRVASTLDATRQSLKRTADLLEQLKPKDDKAPAADSPAVHQLRNDIKVLEQELADCADIRSFVHVRKSIVAAYALSHLPVFVASLASRAEDLVGMDADVYTGCGVSDGWAVYHYMYVGERARQLGQLRARLQAMIKPTEVVKCTCAFEVLLHELEARTKIARVIEADPSGQVERLRRGEPIPIKLRYYSRDDQEISHRIHG